MSDTRRHPYRPVAEITDGDHVCRRCGEHLSQCSLCVGMPSAVRPMTPDELRRERLRHADTSGHRGP